MKNARMKNTRRAAAIRREKRRKTIIMTVCVSVVVVIAAFILFNLYQQLNTRVFSNGYIEVTLRSDGTFTTRLAHGNIITGIYNENIEDNPGIISFVYDGVAVNGNITNKELIIPNEWDDQHGHGTRLRIK